MRGFHPKPSCRSGMWVAGVVGGGAGEIVGRADPALNSRQRMKYAQIFRYYLHLPREDYERRWVQPYAAAIADVPGMLRKTWMADFERGVFASFYLWQDKASMDAFMKSPAIAQVAAEPFLKNLEITEVPVVEEASSITRGV